IACSLLPAFGQFGRENQLFIDETAFRLQSHFVFRYAGLSSGRALFRGGLTPRQEQRVKDFMLAHAASTVSVESLANECGLSRSQFFRAFKYTTGKTPHQWLIQCRVEMSKELLLASERPLAEIARLCGFTNPSHFTRVFSTYVGTAPGAWRIARLS